MWFCPTCEFPIPLQLKRSPFWVSLCGLILSIWRLPLCHTRYWAPGLPKGKWSMTTVDALEKCDSNLTDCSASPSGTSKGLSAAISTRFGVVKSPLPCDSTLNALMSIVLKFEALVALESALSGPSGMLQLLKASWEVGWSETVLVWKEWSLEK